MTDAAPADRVEHYRHMAEATRELASHTFDPEIRASYLELAERWSRLAERAGHDGRSFAPAQAGAEQ